MDPNTNPTTRDMEKSKTQMMTPDQMIMQIASANWSTQALYVGAKLQIADKLADDHRSVDELASMTGCNRDSLHRLMRALCGMGIFAKAEAGKYCNNEMSRLLRKDDPDTLYPFVLMVNEEHYTAWGNLLYAVKTGKTAFDDAFKATSWFDYLKTRPEQQDLFDKAMVSLSKRAGAAVVRAVDYSQASTIIDVGGGYGGLLRQILKAAPRAKGVLYDQPHIIQKARTMVDGEKNITFAEGDFFKSAPSGGDVYLLKHILHDWADHYCISILNNIRAAMGSNKHSRLHVVEFLVSEDGNAPLTGLMDLNMLVMCEGGRERTAHEYEALLKQCGFEIDRIVPIDFRGMGVIIARPI